MYAADWVMVLSLPAYSRWIIGWVIALKRFLLLRRRRQARADFEDPLDRGTARASACLSSGARSRVEFLSTKSSTSPGHAPCLVTAAMHGAFWLGQSASAFSSSFS